MSFFSSFGSLYLSKFEEDLFKVAKDGNSSPLVDIQGDVDLSTIRNAQGQSLLHVCCSKTHNGIDRIVAYRLLKSQQGSDLNAKDNYGKTPLHYACQQGNAQLSDLLVRDGAVVTTTDNLGMTPFHAACMGGSIGCCKVMVAHGVSLRATNQYGNGPLHIAGMYGKDDESQLAMCKWLLTNGANPLLVNHEGLSAAEAAKEKGNVAVGALLDQAMLDTRDMVSPCCVCTSSLACTLNVSFSFLCLLIEKTMHTLTCCVAHIRSSLANVFWNQPRMVIRPASRT